MADAPAPPPADTAAQRTALQGWGTALTGGLIDPNGQTFGGGLNAQQWVDRLNSAYPGAKASLEDVQGSDGQSLGVRVNYDIAGLPQGAGQALGGTGGVEFSDPDSKFNYKGGTDDKVINPDAVFNDPLWGQYTSTNNISDPMSAFDKYGMMATMATIAAMTGGALAPLVAGAGAGAAAGAVDAGAATTGAFDVGGSLGTGLVTGDAAGEAATLAAETAASGAGAGASSGGLLGSITDSLNPMNVINTLTNNISNPSWWLGQAARQGVNMGIGQITGSGQDPDFFTHLAESLGLGALGPTGSLISQGTGLVNAVNSRDPTAAVMALVRQFTSAAHNSGAGGT